MGKINNISKIIDNMSFNDYYLICCVCILEGRYAIKWHGFLHRQYGCRRLKTAKNPLRRAARK